MKTLLLFAISLICYTYSFSQSINTLPKDPKIDLEVSFENNQLIYSISTNIPLPIELMIGISPKESFPNDPAYGFSKRIRLSNSPKKYICKAENTYGLNPTKLKNGEYIAEVKFYPSWGAKKGNPLSSKINDIIKSSFPIIIDTESTGTLELEIEKSIKQTWGIGIAIKDIWVEKKFIKNLGEYQELKTVGRDPKIVKTYYFPQADMTFFVSKTTNQVLMWKLGKVNHL
jgi:hypothetical protein